MKKIKLFFAISFVAFLLTSCTLYQPQTAPIPMMKEKGEMQLDGGLTFAPGIQASAAWSPLNHLAVQGHAFTSFDDIQYAQVALGYYNELPKIFRYEIYGGAGFGNGEYYHNSGPEWEYDWKMSGSYNLYFLQLNAGRTAGKKQRFEYGLGLKGGLMDQNIYEDPIEGNELRYNKNSILIEPAAFMRYGNKFRIGLQVNYANIIPLTYKSEFYKYDPVTVAFTMGFRFNTRAKK